MPALTLYVRPSANGTSDHGRLQIAAPTLAQTSTGWTVGTTASGQYSRMATAAKRPASTFGATAEPSGAPNTSAPFDALRSPKLFGSFATDNWTITLGVKATTASSQAGRARVRIWRSPNRDGSGATEVTSGALLLSTVTVTGTTATSTITTSIPGFSCAAGGEYLFVQIAWEITTAAGSVGADVLIEESSTCLVTTSAYTNATLATVVSTIKSSGGDFSSIAAWAEERITGADLTLYNTVEKAECYAFADTLQATIRPGTAGFTTATNYIHIYAAAAADWGLRGTGAWDTGAFRMSAALSSILRIQDGADFVILEGLQIENTLTNGLALSLAPASGTHPSTSEIQLRRVLLRSTGSSGDCVSINSNGPTHVRNCVMDASSGTYRRALNITGGSGTTYLYNNTAINSAGGFTNVSAGGAVILAKNNLSIASSTAYGSLGWSASSTNNLANDATAPGTAPQNNVTPTFQAGTILLDPADTAAKDHGVDLSADANYPFSVDVLGHTRTGTWDIGAHEYLASSVAGTLAATLAAPTLSAAGAVALAGSLAATLTAPGLSAAGALPVAGALDAALAAPALSAAGTVATVQHVRPVGDVDVGGWRREDGSAVDLYASIGEETPDDGTYVRSGASPSSDAATFALTAAETPQAGARPFRYRYGKDEAGGERIDLTVELLEGETVLGSETHTDVPVAPVEGSFSIDSASVGDWSALRLRVTANAVP